MHSHDLFQMVHLNPLVEGPSSGSILQHTTQLRLHSLQGIQEAQFLRQYERDVYSKDVFTYMYMYIAGPFLKFSL